MRNNGRSATLVAVVVGLSLISVIVLLNIRPAPYEKTEDAGQPPTEVALAQSHEEIDAAGQPPTEVAFAPSPSIYWASDAISRSLELFPEDHHPYDEIAGLLYRGDYESAWMQEFEPDPDVDPEEGVWLVGIRGIGLNEDDILQPFPFLTPSAIYVPRSVDGAFYAWDPNTGYLFADGVLAEPASDNFDLNYQLLVTVLNDYGLPE